MFGGLIGYAVGHITTGLQRWMYVFLIFGSISIAWGIVSLIVLPDLPSTAKFLTERERLIAVNRVAANRQGVKNHHFSKRQAIQTFKDPKTYILFVMAVGAQVPNSALTSFGSIVVGSFGFDTLGTQYLQIPGGAVQFLALMAGGFVCTRWPNNTRCATMIVANAICILGAGLLVGLPRDNKWGRLVALWLCYFQGLGFSMSLTMVSSNVAGYTKKQLTAAVLFTGYCVGNIIGPQTFLDKEKRMSSPSPSPHDSPHLHDLGIMTNPRTQRDTTAPTSQCWLATRSNSPWLSSSTFTCIQVTSAEMRCRLREERLVMRRRGEPLSVACWMSRRLIIGDLDIFSNSSAR